MSKQLQIAIKNFLDNRCCIPPVTMPRLLISPFFYVLIGGTYKILI